MAEVYKHHTPGVSEKALTDIISRHRTRIERDIERFLVDALTESGYLTEDDVDAVQGRVNEELKKLAKAIQEWEKADLRAYYDGYIGEADEDLKRVGIDLRKTLVSGSATMHERAFRNLKSLFETSMDEVFVIVARKSNDIFRDVQYASAMDGFAETDSIKKVVREIRGRLNERGVTGFVDVRGREWSLENYADMAARTVTAQARLRAKEVEFIAHGQDLVLASEHYPTCPKCEPWGNKILSLTGETPGYPTLDEARAAGFLHPNCLHSFSAWIPELADLGIEPTSDAEAREKNLEAQMAADESLPEKYRHPKLKSFTKSHSLIPDEKLIKYALDPSNKRGASKARVFESALGYNLDNADALKTAIYDGLKTADRYYTRTDEYGDRFNATMTLTGPNEKSARVRTGWILKQGDEVFSLTTAFVDDRKGRKKSGSKAV